MDVIDFKFIAKAHVIVVDTQKTENRTDITFFLKKKTIILKK